MGLITKAIAFGAKKAIAEGTKRAVAREIFGEDEEKVSNTNPYYYQPVDSQTKMNGETNYSQVVSPQSREAFNLQERLANGVMGIANYISMDWEANKRKIIDLWNDCRKLKGEPEVGRDATGSVLGRIKENWGKEASKKKIREQFSLLYLANDFILYLTKNLLGVPLTVDQSSMIIKFAPFFDGVDVLEMEEDNNLIAAALGISSAELERTGIYFQALEEYIPCFHDKQVEECLEPDVNTVLMRFENAVKEKLSGNNASAEVKTIEAGAAEEQLLCEYCKYDLRKTDRFCPQCGKKIERKVMYCSKCGTPIVAGTKFCGNCGNGIEE